MLYMSTNMFLIHTKHCEVQLKSICNLQNMDNLYTNLLIHINSSINKYFENDEHQTQATVQSPRLLSLKDTKDNDFFKAFISYMQSSIPT